MTTEDIPLEGLDRELVARLHRVYAPHPLSRAEQRAFDTRLEERIGARSRPRWMQLGAAAAVASVAALLWIVIPSNDRPLGPPGPIALDDVPVDYHSVYEASFEMIDEEALPDDYAAIASVFMGD